MQLSADNSGFYRDPTRFLAHRADEMWPVVSSSAIFADNMLTMAFRKALSAALARSAFC
jgi:hypothetical protein